MATRTRIRQITETCDDSINSPRIALYRADASATPANHPRVNVEFRTVNGVTPAPSDRPLSEYTSLSGAQKTTLGTLLEALYAETLTKEGLT